MLRSLRRCCSRCSAPLRPRRILQRAPDDHRQVQRIGNASAVGKGVGCRRSSNFGIRECCRVVRPCHKRLERDGALVTARGRAATALLRTGKVLVAGGYGNTGAIATAELYDPATGVWSAAGTMSTARSYSTVTVLTSGKVLVAGGLSATGWRVADAELS